MGNARTEKKQVLSEKEQVLSEKKERFDFGQMLYQLATFGCRLELAEEVGKHALIKDSDFRDEYLRNSKAFQSIVSQLELTTPLQIDLIRCSSFKETGIINKLLQEINDKFTEHQRLCFHMGWKMQQIRIVGKLGMVQEEYYARIRDVVHVDEIQVALIQFGVSPESIAKINPLIDDQILSPRKDFEMKWVLLETEIKAQLFSQGKEGKPNLQLSMKVLTDNPHAGNKNKDPPRIGGEDERIKGIIRDLNHPTFLISGKEHHQIKTLCAKPQKQRETGGVDYVLKAPIKESDDAEILQYEKEVRILIKETLKFPNSVHGVVKSTFEGRCKTGTGIVVGLNIVLTAAHNLFHNIIHKGKLEFIPAMNGQSAPFGSFEVRYSYCPENWKDDDYALLVTEESVGLETGFFGLHIAKKDILKTKELHIVGYPAYVRDHNGELVWLSQEGNHQQWSDKGKPICFEEEKLISYQIFTTGGQSGSGVFYFDNETGSYYVIGIHVLKQGDLNTATWITEERFKQIESWSRDYKAKRITEKIKKHEFNNMVELRLLDTYIGKGEAELLANFEMQNLENLFLSENSIEDEGVRILEKAWPKCQIYFQRKKQ